MESFVRESWAAASSGAFGRRGLALLALWAVSACGGSPDVKPPPADASPGGADAGQDASTDGMQPSPGDGSFAPTDGTCAELEARPEPKATAVWFVINPSMLQGLLPTQDGSERYNGEVLRESLFGADGVVPALEGTVQFGLASHGMTATIINGLPNPDYKCPYGFAIPPAHDATDVLSRAYDEDLPDFGGVGWASLEAIQPLIEAQTEPTLNTVVLIQNSRGEGSCELFVDGNALQTQAAIDLAALGARLSVVSILYHPSQATEADKWNREMQERADELAKLGNDGDTFTLMDEEGLRRAVEGAVASAVSCELTLRGEVRAGGECQGRVELDGSPVPCDSEDGYRLLDARTLELTGASCDALRASPQSSLSAHFPCDVFVPLY